MLIALTREVSPSIGQCELTHLERRAIDVGLARTQHHAYQECLSALGCRVRQLPAEPDLPDSVFVEDVAIVLDELAVITRPGADTRRRETDSIARVLRPFRKLCFVEPPGTIDGGDVLRIGKNVYIGLSSRSNASAIEQVQAYLAPFGYVVKGVEVEGCLHLKSAVTQVAENTLLVNPAWVEAGIFGDMDLIEIDTSEPYAANALSIGETVIYPTAFPATQARLEAHGVSTQRVDISELQKAEGAVTCCSLIFDWKRD